MVVYTLEQRWEILRHYIKNHGNCCRMQNHLFRWSSFWSWRICKQAKLSHLGHRKILLLWQKVCVNQHQFTVVLNNKTFRRHHWHEFWIKTLVWRHTKFNWSRNWSQLTIQCVFALLSGSAIDLQKMLILAKKISSFQMKLILILVDM